MKVTEQAQAQTQTAAHAALHEGQVYRKVYVPYRVCPLGAHVDHQHGKITGFALDKGVTFRYLPTSDGEVCIDSRDFAGQTRFFLYDVPHRQGNWGDYARGAVCALDRNHRLVHGVRGIIEGSLPVGGLSSSASVVLCYVIALASVNGWALSERELIDTALMAENEYVGVNVGKLDQSCEVFCRRNQLLHLDTRDDSYQLISAPSYMPPYEIAVFYSGVSRNLMGSAFNMRVDEVKTAAYSLKAYEGMDYGRFAETRMRDVPVDVFRKWEDRLPVNMAKRARHFYTEQARVDAGTHAWAVGDLKRFGQLMFESGHSSIHNWETGSPELIALYGIMLQTKGIYGGRFSGAGFKGCCVALIDPAYREEIRAFVTEQYLEIFPHYEGLFSIHFCGTEDGVGCCEVSGMQHEMGAVQDDPGAVQDEIDVAQREMIVVIS